MKPYICIDFDGTIYDGTDVIEGCCEKLKELQKTYTVMIFSARDGMYREWMIHFLRSSPVPFDVIGPVKPNAAAFIDDKGVHFTNWKDIPCAY